VYRLSNLPTHPTVHERGLAADQGEQRYTLLTKVNCTLRPTKQFLLQKTYIATTYPVSSPRCEPARLGCDDVRKDVV
jgi:hypothetical protein